MEKNELLGFFEEKIRVKILEFCDRINQSEADVYILMARKAACFINVLEEMSLITLNGKVISERLLDTNIDWTGVENIIIIDDVIISGTTLNRTIDKLININPAFTLQVFVIGISDSWFNPELLQDGKGKSYTNHPVKPLDNSQCIRLSGDIVRLLSHYPMPYSIDYPIYETEKFNHDSFSQLMGMPGWEISDTSSMPQKKEDIFTITLIPGQDHLERCGKLFSSDLMKNSLIKVRIYGKKKVKKKEFYSFSFVSMAILPPMSDKQILKLFNYLAGTNSGLLGAKFETLTSKLRFIQFIIADCLAGLFLSEIDKYTNKNMILKRKQSSLRLLFPEDLVSLIIKVAESQLIDVDLAYDKQIIPLKTIDKPENLNDYIAINNALMSPFLNLYYKEELSARTHARNEGKNVFNLPAYQGIIDRLNHGFSYLDLENILDVLPPEIRKLVISSFLDRAIDNGIAVPVTVIENNVVYRAYRHGEDVQFGQREERLCMEMFNTFADQFDRKSYQKIWIEKLFVFFLKIGEEKFLEPIQTEIGNYQHINGKEKNLTEVACVRYYLQGPVVVKKSLEEGKKYNFNPCLDYSDKASWLSLSLVNKSGGLALDNNAQMYTFDHERFKKEQHNSGDQEIIIDKELVKQSVEIGFIFGLLLNNGILKVSPSLNSDELVSLSCCCEPKDVIGALAAEISIVTNIWQQARIPVAVGNSQTGDMERALISCFAKINDVPKTLKAVRSGAMFRAMNDGQRKFHWYVTKQPKAIIDRVSEELNHPIYRGLWDGFWSPNMNWTETSESRELIELAKVEGIWILCFNIYIHVVEYCLNFKASREKEMKLNLIRISEYSERIKFYSGHDKTKEIIPYLNKLNQKFKDESQIERLFTETLGLINRLTFSSRGMINSAEHVFANHRKFPDIKHYTNALYIETESESTLKTVSNKYESVCFKISNTTEDNYAAIRQIPAYDNTLKTRHGKWFVGTGKGAVFWLAQLAIEMMNSVSYNDNYKIFLLPNLPSNCAVKIIDDVKFSYNHFWFYIQGLSSLIQNTPFQNNIFHTIREDTFNENVLNEVGKASNFHLQQRTEIELLLPTKKVFNFSRYINTGKNVNKVDANIGILTIVTEENQAVLSGFGIDPSDYKVKDVRHFYEVDYEFSENLQKKVIVLQINDPGNISVANGYQALLKNYNLDYVVLLGIAGSIQPKVKLCDVIIATSVIYYDKRKESGMIQPERRAEIFNVSFRMNQILNSFFTINSEPAYFLAAEDSANEQYQVVRGPIGSGEAVVADPLSSVKEWLLSVHSKTGVVETEAAGFCKAMYETNQVDDLSVDDVIIIRGVSDHADAAKDDKWRLPASKNAVSVLKKLMLLLYK
jgi:nucleoside phosphorylase